MNQLGTVYATKRRRRNSKSLKPPPKDGITKSNPSKRHRERLNAELDTLASLLPFEASILSKLDKLSILRLSVSYLRTKSYFQAAMYGSSKDHCRNDSSRNHESPCLDTILDSDLILQALNGFLLILASEGEVFFASHTIESYLGFHQSDIVHQSVYELVHSEDREELQRQLMWNSFLPADGANMTLQEVLQPENCQYLERSFTVRFRCLLDNTSGFLRLDIRGRIKVLHGQNRKTEEPPLALFAVCTPFGPPSLLEVPQKDVMFKSKHKLDMSLVSMDQRGKMLLGYSDSDLSNKGGYDLVHFDDLAYVANAHQELLKTGASGMIAYRVITKESQWQWLQTSSRLVYKCSKPDFIICTHRPLMEEEGRDLLGKRTMDFKVSYLDATLSSSSYVTDSSEYTTATTTTRSPKGRRYKNQLRDILTTCRKRKVHGNEYAEEPNYNNVYPYPTDNGIGPYVQSNLQNLYPTLDNSRYFSAEDFLQYRHLSNYYTDYTHSAPYAAMGNGYLDVSARTCLPPSYADGSQLAKEEKLYPCQLESAKYNNDAATRLLGQNMANRPTSCCDGYSDPRGCIVSAPVPTASAGLQPLLGSIDRDCKLGAMTGHGPITVAGQLHVAIDKSKLHDSSALRSLKNEQQKHQSMHSIQPLHASSHNHHHLHDLNSAKPSIVPPYSNDTRQTVLMWGSTGVTCRSVTNSTPSSSSSSSSLHMYTTAVDKAGRCYSEAHLKPDAILSSSSDLNLSCKWGNSVNNSPPKSTPPHSSSSPHVVHSGRVLTPASYSNSPYGSDAANELQHVRSGVEKHDGNPLLSISEVTNALLSHD